MSLKMKPDDALAYRMALEPLTHKMVAEAGEYSHNDAVLPLSSIAISLKRIADALAKQDKGIGEIKAPVIAYAGDGSGDMIVRHPAWDHGLRIIRGVVLIDASELLSAEHHGWQQMPRATTKVESDRGLIRVYKI